MAAGNLCETLSALREALKQDREKARKTAPRFNIFRLLGVERREVETHSALLAELFDPAGMHAQGDFFITSFLQYLAKKDPDRFGGINSLIQRERPTDWRFQREYVTAGYGIPDLVLCSDSLKFILVIENKIDASEGSKQLSNYAKWLDTLNHVEKDRKFLILLTPERWTGAVSDSSKYLHITYEKDISKWLGQMLKEDRAINAKNVAEILEQYRSLVATISRLEQGRREEMKKEREEVMKLLKDTSVFSDAIELAELVNQYRGEIVEEFWGQLRDAIQKKLRETPA